MNTFCHHIPIWSLSVFVHEFMSIRVSRLAGAGWFCCSEKLSNKLIGRERKIVLGKQQAHYQPGKYR